MNSRQEKALKLAAKPVLWVLVLAAGVGGWLVGLLLWDAQRAWHALLFNFLFFTPMTAGMVVWPAVVLMSNGKWARPIEGSALAGMIFAPFSIVAFIVLFFVRSYWAVWIGRDTPQGLWLNYIFLFLRDGAALLIIWGVAYWFSLSRTKGRSRHVLMGSLITLYCLVFSLVGFDMVMALDPHWYSSLFGAYFFVSGMYAAIAGWTISYISHAENHNPAHLRDLGNLMLAFSLLTTYMMFSQLLPIWYENLPQEVRFVLPRYQVFSWRWISVVLLLTIYLGPLVMLLWRKPKRSPLYLGAVALVILAGLWLERWWLVIPTLRGEFELGLIEFSMTAIFAAIIILGFQRFHKHVKFAEAPEKAGQ